MRLSGGYASVTSSQPVDGSAVIIPGTHTILAMMGIIGRFASTFTSHSPSVHPTNEGPSLLHPAMHGVRLRATLSSTA
tara:strand:- start:1855 stop:2088 length:234 start_codon:yes stop_codon:yes gene_type:complete